MIDLEKAKKYIYPEQLFVRGDHVPYELYEMLPELIAALEEARFIMEEMETAEYHKDNRFVYDLSRKFIAKYFPTANRGDE